MSKDLISIVIPVYKVEAYLRECLDSVLAQTYQNWEAICVNDGSPDGCGAILDEYAKKDKRFVVIHKENEGVSSTRNVGLRHVKGDYITFLDSDDIIYPQFLEYMLKTILDDNTDVVCCDKLKGKKHISYISTMYKNKNTKIVRQPLIHLFKHKNPKISVSVWGKVYKRKVIEKIYFNHDFKISAEDYLFIIEVFNKVERVSVVKEKLIYYRLNENSLTHKINTFEYIKDHYNLIKKICEVIKSEKIFRIFKKDIITNILKDEYNRCNHYDDKVAFAEQFMYLKENKLISFSSLGGYRYFLYMNMVNNIRNGKLSATKQKLIK